MIRGIPGISLPSIAYRAQGGRTAFPVDPSSLIYSHFEHVSGVAAPKGTQGVSISKLNLLDVLIRRLNEVKKAAAADPRAVPAEQLDSLIESYRKQIVNIRAASAAMPYIPSPGVRSGTLFSITA